MNFGAKACGRCATPAPPHAFDDVFWSIPDGYFARRISLALKPNDDRRFIVPAGVAVMALIDGMQRGATAPGLDYWTVLSARTRSTSFEGEQLRNSIESRCGNRSPVLTVVLARPGPHSIMMEWAELPTRSGLAAHVQLNLEFDVSSVEKVLRAFLPSNAEAVSVDEVETRVANSLSACISGALQSFGLDELLSAEARTALLAQIRPGVESGLEAMGISPRSITITRLGAKELEEMKREQAGAEIDARRVSTLQLRSQTELQNQQVLLEHLQSLESIDSRKQAVIMAAATRTASGEIHGLRERERVQQVIREMERALQVEQVISEADLQDLVAQRNDAAQRDATIRSIGLRNMLREHELAELKARLHVQDLEGRAGRADRISDAQAEAEIAKIELISQRDQADFGMQLKARELRMEQDRLDLESRRRQEEADAAHRRSVDLESRKQEFELRVLELHVKMSAEQLAMVRNIDPDLARALFRDDQRASASEQVESLRKAVEGMTQARIDELKAQVARMEDGQVRKDDQMAALHASTMKSLVELVANLRQESSRTTINVAGGDRARWTTDR